MRWSFRVGKIFGIEFRVHVTFLLLLAFIYLAGLDAGGPKVAWVGVLFISSIFACVVIHEIGHSLIARRFGTEAKSITLLPIGGVATMEEMPEKPSQEIAMALVGPLINLAIAGGFYLAAGGRVGLTWPVDLFVQSGSEFLSGFITINIVLAAFNLLPGFPMDGGRVLRGLLALKLDYVTATSIAVFIGQAFSMFFIFSGFLLYPNPWLVIIGVFLYMGAGGEKRHVMLRTVLRGVWAEEAMTTDFLALRPDEPVSTALEHVYHGCQSDFPVVGDSGIEGVLSHTNILAAVHAEAADVPVSEVMDRDFPRVTPDTSLYKVYRQFLEGNRTTTAVVEGGELKGMLSLDSIGRFLMIQSALKGIETGSVAVRQATKRG